MSFTERKIKLVSRYLRSAERSEFVIDSVRVCLYIYIHIWMGAQTDSYAQASASRRVSSLRSSDQGPVHTNAFSKVCVFSEFDPTTRSRYCERFQKFALSLISTRPHDTDTVAFSNLSTLEIVFESLRFHRKRDGCTENEDSENEDPEPESKLNGIHSPTLQIRVRGFHTAILSTVHEKRKGKAHAAAVAVVNIRHLLCRSLPMANETKTCARDSKFAQVYMGRDFRGGGDW